ncbi:hypothetical protein EC844_11377 [Acinetobacter calcoaceticus]|uniref:Uncharacterized protein n=1 Tax=Acinetobacter calcoaceticus TaxID=471 RepID=A0A4R1XQD1_ACICA|nr:hypothetical protein EC844_11377 [Acinetobacter calcoaceticus]
MNGIFLALSVIVIGYIYQNRNLVTKYSTSEMPAHHLYYKSAITGFIFFFIGLICTFSILLKFSLIEYHQDKNLIDNIHFLPDLKILWVMSFCCALILCLCFVWLKNYILLRGIDRVNNINKIYAMTLTTPLDKLLNDSAFLSEDDFKNKIVLLSMNDKKVYVGTVFPDRKIFERFLYGQTEFIFCPMYSGYRHKETMELVITTDYLKDQNLDQHKYQMILDRKNIVTATKVDLDTLFDFMDRDVFFNKLSHVSRKKLPVLVIMKNKNIYIGRLSDNMSNYSTLSDVTHIGLNLGYQCIFDRDQIKIGQYYDFRKTKDLYCHLSFREVESIWFRTKPEDFWMKDKHVSPEMLLKLFEHRLVDCREVEEDLIIMAD